MLLVVFYGRAKICLGIYVKNRRQATQLHQISRVCHVRGRPQHKSGQDKTRSHRSPHVHNNVKKCFNSPQVDSNCASCDALGHLRTLREPEKEKEEKKSSEVQLGANQGDEGKSTILLATRLINICPDECSKCDISLIGFQMRL